MARSVVKVSFLVVAGVLVCVVERVQVAGGVGPAQGQAPYTGMTRADLPPEDPARRWLELCDELAGVGYRHVGVDSGGEGWIDHEQRLVCTDRELLMEDELKQLARLVATLRRTREEAVCQEVRRRVAGMSTSELARALRRAAGVGRVGAAPTFVRCAAETLRERWPQSFAEGRVLHGPLGQALPTRLGDAVGDPVYPVLCEWYLHEVLNR